jgi:hypothetical protein
VSDEPVVTIWQAPQWQNKRQGETLAVHSGKLEATRAGHELARYEVEHVVEDKNGRVSVVSRPRQAHAADREREGG